MEDNNNKKSYDDFFRSRHPEEPKDEEQYERSEASEQGEEQSERKPSYYYSYGPFKAGDGQTEGPASRYQDQGRSQADSGASHQTDVQITPPQRPRPYAPVASSSHSGKNGWQVKEKRRTSFKAMFASFLAGVLVVGTLMGLADYNNWFTSNGILPSKNTELASTSSGDNAPSSPVSSVLDTSRPNNIAQIFEQASPAVVKIETYASVNNGQGGSRMDPFWQFFREPSAPNGGGESTVPTGVGSGFIFEDTGYILTNEHVVSNASKIEVTLQGYPKAFEAEKLGSSYELDLAVLKITDDEAFPTLPLGDSSAINIGDWVVAIGNPHGFDHTITVGVLSAKERPINIPDAQGVRQYEHLLQTDASINPGNSGGPLLNTSGEVIGINTAVSTDAQGIGFAIPTSTIKEVVDTLKANEEIPKEPVPFIGAELRTITEDFAEQLGLEDVRGALVNRVYYRSPAYQGDLRQFDVITGIDGQDIDTTETLIEEIQKRQVGDNITLNVTRDGRALELTIELGDKNEFNQVEQ
ncbi:S1C family serine protease [Paenibacillus daejeonensis]|uniref:S1C family serine protease n=1 Tax=Paenibacillus daejeonensis TaxID=135193 RepID=UPI00036419FA|nr:trypsin-like peptidase domain-containing protein [Paenibacillus daejeonensis]